MSKIKQVPKWLITAIPLMLTAMIAERKETADKKWYNTQLLNATMDEIERIKARDGTEKLDKKQRREATNNAKKIVKKLEKERYRSENPEITPRSTAANEESRKLQKERERRSHEKREKEAKLRHLANQHLSNQKAAAPSAPPADALESKMEQIQNELTSLEKELAILESVRDKVDAGELVRTKLRTKQIERIPELQRKISFKEERIEDYTIVQKLGLDFKKGTDIDTYKEIIQQTKAKQREIARLEQENGLLNDKELRRYFYDIILIGSTAGIAENITKAQELIKKLTDTFNQTFGYRDITLGYPNITTTDISKFKAESIAFILNTAASLKKMDPSIALEPHYHLTPEQRNEINAVEIRLAEIEGNEKMIQRINSPEYINAQVEKVISNKLADIDNLPMLKRIPQYFKVAAMFVCDLFKINYFRKMEEADINKSIKIETDVLKNEIPELRVKNCTCAAKNATSIFEEYKRPPTHVEQLRARESDQSAISRI